MLLVDGFSFPFSLVALVAVDKSGCSERSLKCINIFTYLVLLLCPSCGANGEDVRDEGRKSKEQTLACIQRE